MSCTGVPDFIFEGCCEYHDRDYQKGANKFKADYDFLRRMMGRVKKQERRHKRVFYGSVAVTYYLGVTIFGWWGYWRAYLKRKRRTY